MNKVVCDVCGTSYPENAAQCPICGFAHSIDTLSQGDDGAGGSYTYVKGGRFSKANVKKRNSVSQYTATDEENAQAPVLTKSKKKSNAGLVLLIIFLSLAIIVVSGFIVLRFFVPNDYLYIGPDGFTLPAAAEDVAYETEQAQDAPEDTLAAEPASVQCVSLTLSQNQITFTSVGEFILLSAQCDPADTTDLLVFSSADEAVATVDASGLVTASGEGSTVITVTCGTASAQCEVLCLSEEPDVPEDNDTVAFMLNRMEITFQAEGESWMLYDGEIPLSEILWSSDDNSVATITDGKVVAVANGDTTVYGIYGSETVSCTIHCNFADESGSNSGGISEAGGSATRELRLYNPYGNADDVTIKVDEEFTLKLVDADKNEITDAQWRVDAPECCSYTNGIVKGLKAGTANVTATYEGVTYTCIVRVS